MVKEAFLPSGSFFNMSGTPATLSGRTRTVLDFWSWAYSDLMQNITRGYVAQYIVAWALGVDDKPSNPWQSFDLLAPNGKRIEVKSTASLQAWTHGKKSRKPLFVIEPKRPYDGVLGLGPKADWNADLYVLCYFYWTDPAAADIMDLDQWKIWVFTKAELIKAMKGRKSLTVQALEREGFKPVTAFGLCDEIIHSE